VQKKTNYNLTKLLERAESDEAIDSSDIFAICELLENNNPSHIAAFLFPIFLQCPLIKKDLCISGTFSIAQATELYSEALAKSIAKENVLEDEFRRQIEEFSIMLHMKGTPMSHMSSIRAAAKKGVSSGFVYSAVYDGH